MAEQPVTEQQAIDKAVDVGKRTYGDIDRFDVTTEDDPEQWKVNFRDRHALVDGESAHFAVRVDKRTGEAHLFRGR